MGKIGVHLVKEGHDLPRRVEKAATRTRPYRRKRLDGTYIDDIEWSLGELEGIAAPVLREFDARWLSTTMTSRNSPSCSHSNCSVGRVTRLSTRR